LGLRICRGCKGIIEVARDMAAHIALAEVVRRLQGRVGGDQAPLKL
jgi:hypothetical protein